VWGVGEDRPVSGTRRYEYYNTNSPLIVPFSQDFSRSPYHSHMPVIVLGADSEVGRAVVERLQTRAGEIRAFVSDLTAATALRARGVNVAVGDVSDFSHIEAASTGAYCAILVAQAATDGREVAFADPQQVVEGWMEAVRRAAVTRVIVVGDAPLPGDGAFEVVAVLTGGRSLDEVADEVAALDDAPQL